MTLLATHALDDPDQMSLFADPWFRKPFADAFREACEAEARMHDGWIDPSRVRERLLDHPSYKPQQLSALWSSSCGRDGFMEKTAMPVRITGEGSRGNTNKSTFWRVLRTQTPGAASRAGKAVTAPGQTSGPQHPETQGQGSLSSLGAPPPEVKPAPAGP